MTESQNSNLPAGLTVQVPRSVRMLPGIWQLHVSFLSLLLVFEVLLFGGVWLLNRYYFVKPIAELQARGMKAEGTVTSITSTRIRGSGGSYRYTAHFDFPVASGGSATVPLELVPVTPRSVMPSRSSIFRKIHLSTSLLMK